MDDLTILPRSTPRRIVSEFFAGAREEAVRFERTVHVKYFDRSARRGPVWITRTYAPDGSYNEQAQDEDAGTELLVRTELLRMAQERHPEATDWFSVLALANDRVARCNICDGYIALWSGDDIPAYARDWIREHEEVEQENLLYGH